MHVPSVLLTMRVNGDPVQVAVRPHHTLLDVLRDTLALTGTKQGCDSGDCGVCTVQLDGEPVLSCLVLALQAEGAEVLTIEGIGGASPHPLQDALDRHDAAQCGYCMPGIVLSAEHLLRTSGGPVTRDEAARALAGNLCRCTGYVKILDAVVDASQVASGTERSTTGDATEAGRLGATASHYRLGPPTRRLLVEGNERSTTGDATEAGRLGATASHYRLGPPTRRLLVEGNGSAT